ncbi:sensor histidine kinase [Taibaiella koreensis]|uniref:sensor histidine kinase n=1 Tax=Taibaiella koreensis TaxID=1268548 RepID=UPI0013C2D918|nr:sensor histidine kinase [Taibaiella koreensis]
MRRSVIVLLHTCYWLLYLLLITTILLALPKTRPPLEHLAQVLFFSPFAAFALLPGVLGFYSYYLVLFDRWLMRKRLLACVVWGILFALVAGGIATFLLSFPLNALGQLRFPQSFFMGIFLCMLAGIHGIIGLVLKGFIRWYGDIRIKEELQRRHHETELALIKSQINPHFLFNTINNIDVLIGKDPVKASLFLNQLSGIMRYMLYETRTEKVPLAKELDYIEAYLDLQRIRSANRDFVQYNLQGDPGNHMIAPMLLIAYIENAFKHAAGKREGPAVQISVGISAERIEFRCDNYYQRNGVRDEVYSGLGNELLQRRLELLYPGRHRLSLSDQSDLYSVQLILDNHED